MTLTSADILERFPAIEMDEQWTRPAMDEALVFAESRGLTDRLLADLERLTLNDKKVTLYKDFAPHSFTFQWYLHNPKTGEYEKWLYGGFIFYDVGDTGVGAPQFSVSLTPTRESGWYVHT